MSDGRPLRVLSWNVNGLRACARKGFAAWLRRSRAELVGLQEVRARPVQLPEPVKEPPRWWTHFAPAERPGYSGVAVYARRPPDELEAALGRPAFDAEGRFQCVRLGRLVVANVYFPNGNGRERDNSRVPFKLDFYRAVFERLQALRRSGRRVLVMGDFNTAHREIDLARPRANRETSGFLPEERAELDRWRAAGWTDCFRRFEPRPHHYTWWSQRSGARERNVGWRIDYVWASPAALRYVRRAFHQPRVTGSDHCPVGVEIDAEVLR